MKNEMIEVEEMNVTYIPGDYIYDDTQVNAIPADNGDTLIVNGQAVDGIYIDVDFEAGTTTWTAGDMTVTRNYITIPDLRG